MSDAVKRAGIIFLASGTLTFVVSVLATLTVLALMGADLIPFDRPPRWSFISLVGSVWLMAVGGALLIGLALGQRESE